MTYKLKTQFSQLPNGQISKSQCPSDAEYPEFSENGLTFDPSPFLLGVMVKKTVAPFFGTTCICMYYTTIHKSIQPKASKGYTSL